MYGAAAPFVILTADEQGQYQHLSGRAIAPVRL
jgi:hypothetical protein